MLALSRDRAASRASEPLQLRKPQLSPVHMHLPVLGAAREGGDRLAGVEKAGGSEGLLDGEEGLALGGRELHAHRVELLDPHAVLASDGATVLVAGPEDLGT